MATPVPEIVTRYLDASAAKDTDGIVACFTEDAVVTDDGRTMTGLAEIRSWREDVTAAFEYTTTVRSAEEEPGAEDVWTVHTQIAGDFPGSPVDLAFRFRLSGDRIVELDIAP